MHLETVNCIITGSVVALHYICYLPLLKGFSYL